MTDMPDPATPADLPNPPGDRGAPPLLGLLIGAGLSLGLWALIVRILAALR